MNFKKGDFVVVTGDFYLITSLGSYGVVTKNKEGVIWVHFIHLNSPSHYHARDCSPVYPVNYKYLKIYEVTDFTKAMYAI